MQITKDFNVSHGFKWLQRKNNSQSNQQSSQIFLTLLQITGLKIKLNTDVKLGILRRVYVVFIFLICVGNLFCVGIIAFITRTGYFSFVTKIDPFVQMAIIYTILRQRKINALFTDIWRIAHDVNPNIKITFWIHFGYLFFAIYLISTAGLLTQIIYFENLSRKIYAVAVIYFAITKLFAQLCSNLFCTFIALNLYLLNESFTELTTNFHVSNTSFKSKLEFSRKYLQMANLTSRFNEVFSPIVTIFAITRILQIIIEVTLLSTLSPSEIIFQPIKYAESCTFIAQVIVTFMVIVELGQKLKNQAQDGIASLLKSGLEHSQDMDTITHIFHSELKNCKECKLISMFSGRMVVSPVTIAASDLFTVDYSLILAVISVSVTYISLIQPRNQEPNCTMKPPMMFNRTGTTETTTVTQIPTITTSINTITTIKTDATIS